MEATILHADLDAFFAAVEQRDDPRLRGRPVLVGAWVVLAASYEAKAHGVDTAMGVARALRLCPNAVVVEPRSMYLLRGPSRDEWEHSIPPVGDLRYSITLRTFRG